ncbi:hypothetical protein [Streptomyces sp. NPDC005181]|uniref:hypothetical protein n=1 Tax=Streptomyces sp. NPDC005181 TaxID=3156869 RepID=UPI0033B5E700
MADNVARLIAAASALASASTMTISYATYRRARPRLGINADVSDVSISFPAEGRADMNLRVRLINHGQATIKLGDDLLVRFGPGARRRILNGFIGYGTRRLNRFMMRLPRWRVIRPLDDWRWKLVDSFDLHRHHGSSMPLPEDAEKQVEPFGAVEWKTQREWMTLGQRREWTYMRVELTLPAGVTVRSRWIPVAYVSKADPDPDALQLSFDDIAD